MIHWSKPWAYFDGVAQVELLMGRVGIILHISQSQFIKFKVGIGHGPNTKAELVALNCLLTLTVEFGVSNIQVFGDSLNFLLIGLGGISN